MTVIAEIGLFDSCIKSMLTIVIRINTSLIIALTIQFKTISTGCNALFQLISKRMVANKRVKVSTSKYFSFLQSDF